MSQETILSVVVASPADVQTERNILEEVINELNAGIARLKDLRLELIRWETDSYPGFHPEGPQGLIDPILNINDCDVFIGIFWKRFGSPVKDAGSGTEHEFRQAYEAWKINGSPRIMFYFNQKPNMPTSLDEAEQMQRVILFKENFPKEGLWWTYNGENEFEKFIRNHLTKFIMDYSVAEAEEQEEDNELLEEDNEDIEPKTLHDEQLIIKGKSHESYDFTFEVGNKLIVAIESTEPVDVVIIDSEDTEAWLNNQEIDTYVLCENRKRVRFNFDVEENGEYSVIIMNHAYFTDAEIDVEISYLE